MALRRCKVTQDFPREIVSVNAHGFDGDRRAQPGCPPTLPRRLKGKRQVKSYTRPPQVPRPAQGSGIVARVGGPGRATGHLNHAPRHSHTQSGVATPPVELPAKLNEIGIVLEFWLGGEDRAQSGKASPAVAEPEMGLCQAVLDTQVRGRKRLSFLVPGQRAVEQTFCEQRVAARQQIIWRGRCGLLSGRSGGGLLARHGGAWVAGRPRPCDNTTSNDHADNDKTARESIFHNCGIPSDWPGLSPR